MHICLHLDDVIISWEPTSQADFVAQRFLDSRLQYVFLEGLMDFLAFLVLTFRQTKQILIRGIPTSSLGISCQIRGLSAITLAPETQGSRSRALQIHITA